MRLIDADKLIDEINNSLWDWDSVDGITATTVLKQTITDIQNQPTVERVIRCKDCEFGAILPKGRFCIHGVKIKTGQKDEDWFCADARPKQK